MTQLIFNTIKEGDKIQVDVKPEVKLGDYKSIELEKVEYNVTDEIMDNELKIVQNATAPASVLSSILVIKSLDTKYKDSP